MVLKAGSQPKGKTLGGVGFFIAKGSFDRQLKTILNKRAGPNCDPIDFVCPCTNNLMG